MYESTGKSTFGARLKQARYRSGLRQSDLAAALGVSASTVQSWEQGARNPRAPMLAAIAAKLDRPIAWFFEIDEVAA